MYICKKCGKPHNGSYGSGRFCSATCARTYSNTFVTEEGRKKQISVLNNEENRKKNLEKRNEISKYREENDENYYKNREKAKSIFNYESKRDRNRNNKKKLGNIGEAAVISEFVKHDIPVYQSFGDNESADMIADFGGKPQKIQVKSSSVCCKDYIIFRTSSTQKGENGKYTKSEYSTAEVDYFAFYDYNKNDIYIKANDNDIPKRNMLIRYTKPLTNNGTNHNYASEMRLEDFLNKIENYPMFFYNLYDHIILY